MLHPKMVRRTQRCVLKAVEKYGGRIMLGAHHRPEISPTFMEPTIVTDLPLHSDLLKQEITGPLVLLAPFTDVAQVVRVMSSHRNVGGAALFTRDMGLAASFIATAQANTICINDVYLSLYSTWKAPLQGRFENGNGIRHGGESLYQFTRVFSATRASTISPLPVEPRGGSWNSRMAYKSMKFYSWVSRHFTDTYLMDSLRVGWRRFHNSLVGPV